MFNGHRGNSGVDGDSHSPVCLVRGGWIELSPVNSVHYKFRSCRFYFNNADVENATGFGHGDGRFAAFGLKGGERTWLGAVSCNNTAVDTSNITDVLTPTTNIVLDTFIPSPDSLSPKSTTTNSFRWDFMSSKVGFYSSYRIKMVSIDPGETYKIANELYSVGQNFHEIEFE